MISICLACSHMACHHRIDPSRLTHSSFVRLLKIDLRVIRAVSSSSSFIRYGRRGRSRRRHLAGVVSDIPTACGLASISTPIRYGRRGDDVLVVSICRRYQSMAGGGSYQGASFISIRSRSRSPTPFRPALRLSDTRNGTGACLLSLVPLSVVSRSCRWCSGW